MTMPLLLRPLRLPLGLLPDALHAQLFARAFNHMLRGQALTSRLRELDDRTLCVHITDAPARLCFRIRAGGLHPAHATHSDVTIRGRLDDFWLLASRREDPDTLFFSRRLCLEGDTATGLHVKNLIDALDYDWAAHVHAVLPAPLARRLLTLVHRLSARHSMPGRPYQ